MMEFSGPEILRAELFLFFFLTTRAELIDLVQTFRT